MSDIATQTPTTGRAGGVRKYIVWAVALVVLVLLGLAYRNSQQTRPVVGNRAPDLDLNFYAGYEWNSQPAARLSDLQGNVVVLNFWASWCAPCRDEAEFLEAVSREYADRGVVFLGVAWSDTERKAIEYLAEYDITYPNAPDLGLGGADTYRITGVPETYVIDRDGTIRYFHEGPLTVTQLRQLLESTLNG